MKTYRNPYPWNHEKKLLCIESTSQANGVLLFLFSFYFHLKEKLNEHKKKVFMWFWKCIAIFSVVCGNVRRKSKTELVSTIEMERSTSFIATLFEYTEERKKDCIKRKKEGKKEGVNLWSGKWISIKCLRIPMNSIKIYIASAKRKHHGDDFSTQRQSKRRWMLKKSK